MSINDLNTDPVAQQYEEWPYPSPLDESKKWRRPTNMQTQLRRWWPTTPPAEPLSILIAGCGTRQAAQYAYRFPEASVIGIDISQVSLGYQQKLKDKLQLNNLTLKQLPIESVHELKQEFDLIIASGVLHHLEDPNWGLKCLKEELKPNGVIEIMLYGKYGRNGMSMLAELFNSLNLQQDEEGLQIVKETLKSLPKEHPAHHFIRFFEKGTNDIELVDAYLHKRYRDYDVNDCLELVKSAELQFRSWNNNGLYYPNLMLPANGLLSKKMEQLEDPYVWKAMEKFHGVIYKHTFSVCHDSVDSSSFKADFDSNGFKNYIPYKAPSFFQTLHTLGISHPDKPWPILPYNPKNKIEDAIHGSINGKNTVEACLRNAGIIGSEESQLALAKIFFKKLWRTGYIDFLLK